MDKQMNRDYVIIRTSVIGIIANVLLAAFKAVIGTATHSIAIVMDAVNNLSDALSSIITIVGILRLWEPSWPARRRTKIIRWDTEGMRISRLWL